MLIKSPQEKSLHKEKVARMVKLEKSWLEKKNIPRKMDPNEWIHNKDNQTKRVKTLTLNWGESGPHF